MKKEITNKNKELAYGITQIRTKSITINEPEHFSQEKIDVVGEIALGTIVLDHDQVELSFEIKTQFLDNTTEGELVAHVGLTKFKIVNLQGIKDKDDNTLSIPDELMVTMYGIAHTHARALLSVDLKNTIFRDQLFIPIIDPKVILNYKPNTDKQIGN